MRNNKFLLYIVLTIIFAGLLIFGLLKVSDTFQSDSDGVITVVIMDNGNVVAEKNIEFNVDDNLEDLIINNFEGVRFTNGMLMDIEGIVTPSDYSYFFWSRINGIDLTVGAKDVEFEDKDVIEFIFTKNTYNENS